MASHHFCSGAGGGQMKGSRSYVEGKLDGYGEGAGAALPENQHDNRKESGARVTLAQEGGAEIRNGWPSSSYGSVRAAFMGHKELGFGAVNNIIFNELNEMMEDWLSRCAVGRLRGGFNLSSIQVQLCQAGIFVRVRWIGEAFYLLFFLEPEDQEICLLRYVDMFEHWFDIVTLWEDSDLVKTNRRWISFAEFHYFCGMWIPKSRQWRSVMWWKSLYVQSTVWI